MFRNHLWLRVSVVMFRNHLELHVVMIRNHLDELPVGSQGF